MINPKKTHFHPIPSIAVTSISFSKNTALRKKLKNIFPNSFFNESGNHLSEQKLINFLKNTDAAIVGSEQITDKVLSQTSQLKIISKYGVGLDSIDLESLKKRNVALGWTAGVNQRSVSELTLCFMLGLCRNVFESGYKLKKAQWEKSGGQQLTGKTIGIIGCGNIGSDLIKLLKPFKCNILVNDIIDKSELCGIYNALQTDLNNLIAKSDLISLHVPLTAATTKLVNQSFLGGMKSSAYLINTSRGNVVDQFSLKRALQEKKIAGAGLDVFSDEPPSDQQFLDLPNLMSTPHIGGNAREAIELMGQSAIEHLVKYFTGHSFLEV